MRNAHILFVFLAGFFLFSSNTSLAQNQKTTNVIAEDSLKTALRYRDSLLHKAKKSDTYINSQLDKIEYYTASSNQINSALSRGIDTMEISNRLPRLERGIRIIKETVSNNDHSSTLRYLYAVRDILTHIEDQLDDWQDKLSQSNARLIKIQTQILEFKRDTSLNYIPTESTLRNQYVEQLSVLNTKFTKLEAISRKKFLSIGLLQNRVVQNYVRITDYKNQINSILDKFSEKALSKEYPYLWQSKSTDYQNSLDSAWKETLKMNQRLITYFVISNYEIHFLGILLLLAFFYWISVSLKRIRKNNKDAATVLDEAAFIPKHSFSAALLFACVVILFFYDHPPVIFVEMVMFIMLICTAVLLHSFWPKKLYKFWLVVIALVAIYDLGNLFVKICYTDRLLVFLLSIACLVTGYAFLKAFKKAGTELPSRYLLILKIFMFLQAVSLLLNIAGRFSIAKILGFTAISGLWQAVSLFVFVRIVMEAIFLHIEATKLSDKGPSYFDYKTLQSRLQKVLRYVAFGFWAIWIAENFNIIDFLVDTSTVILSHEHTLGDTKFTFGNVLVFVIIIWIASALTKIITYFFEFADQHAVTTTRKNKLSSSILLVKLTIFGVGFLLAILASSIPVSKINIIIGALSVGIGFGLQTIVNNLVSGVILAFERPVQIGDLIEVGVHSGTIKEMGIRASKIATAEGSEIIIPNGDLLSQHLVNWTLSNNNRRVELNVGVAYGTEIEKVRKLLYHLISGREDIMQEPQPLVLVHTFGEKAVNFRILFWVPDLSKWLEKKSRVMSDIYEAFQREGIVIPSA